MSKGQKKLLNILVGEQDGMALMSSTLAIFVVLILLATTIVPLMVNERREASTVIGESKAAHNALTGLERGVQQYRTARVPPLFSRVPFHTGTYNVGFSAVHDETGGPLPWCNYIMIVSRGRIGERELIPSPPGQGGLKYKRWDVERNMRIFLSSLPHAFLFALYSQNLDNGTLDLGASVVNGPAYFRGNVNSSTAVSEGVYTPSGFSAATGSVQYHPDPQPPFPYLDEVPYLTLLATASTYPSQDYVLEKPPQGKPVFLDLTEFVDSTLYVNGKVILTQVSVKGPGKIVATDSVKITSTPFQDRIMVVSGEASQVRSTLTMGSGVCFEEDGVIIYSNGEVTIENSEFYGLVISKGRLVLDGSTCFGAFLSFSRVAPAAPDLIQNSTLTGSLVTKKNISLVNSNIVRGALPLAEGEDIGLEPYIIPGTWLEY